MQQRSDVSLLPTATVIVRRVTAALARLRSRLFVESRCSRAQRYTDIFVDDMTIIVAGQIEVQPGQRQRFLESSEMAMRLARETTGCEDFVVAADPLDEHRVNVFEMWRSRKALHDFRDAGPDDGLTSLIVRARVREYEV